MYIGKISSCILQSKFILYIFANYPQDNFCGMNTHIKWHLQFIWVQSITTISHNEISKSSPWTEHFVKCLACKKNFESTRGLSLHTFALSYCLKLSQLVQKLITLLPENKQSNVATIPPTIPADLDNEIDDNFLSDNSNNKPDITCDNDNIDESTNQKTYFSHNIFLKWN